MKDHIRGFSILVLGIAVISLSGCISCGTSYRRDLSNNPGLAEANTSYKKAITWLDKAECCTTAAEAQSSYATAESYLSDAIFKLNQLGHDKDINVSDDVYYCEKIKRETDVKIGAAGRAKRLRLCFCAARATASWAGACAPAPERSTWWPKARPVVSALWKSRRGRKTGWPPKRSAPVNAPVSCAPLSSIWPAGRPPKACASTW